MIATVSSTRKIADSFRYARAVDAPEKGGRIVKSNCIIADVPIEVQLAMMDGFVSDQFDLQAYTIILSHSLKDREMLKKLKEEDPDLLDMFVDNFVNELQNRGIDLANTPYVITEHTNTDCLHYHFIISSTKFDNSRLDTGYIGKKAAIAAAAVSRKFGLHYAKKLDEREKTFIRKSTKNEKSTSDFPLQRKRRSKDQIAEDAARKKKKNMERAQAIREANERKNFLKNIVEFAFENSKNKSEFRAILSEKNIGLGKIEGKGWCVRYIDKEKARLYQFQKLGISSETVSAIETMLNSSFKTHNNHSFGNQISLPSAETIENTIGEIRDVFMNSSNWTGNLFSLDGSEKSGGISGGGNGTARRKKKEKNDKEGRGRSL